jgi:phosphate transport system substrate-binding protein
MAKGSFFRYSMRCNLLVTTRLHTVNRLPNKITEVFSLKMTVILSGFLVLSAGAACAQDLNGAGATFPNPIYSRWFTEYSRQHPGVQINYQSVGSGAGIRQVSEGTVDFGASDAVMTEQQINEAKIKVTAIPTVLGAVVPIYNIPGVNAELKFSQDAIAGIYLGKITKWNDPYIAHENPGVNLPDKPILTVHRTDGSGTTYIFTDYLSKVSPEWEKNVGRNAAVKWPSAGIGGKGNEGVAGLVEHTPYSIGYVELVYAEANKIPFGLIRNASGKFVKASTAGVTAAAAADAKMIPADYRVSITNAPGAESYPISSFTWLLIPTHSADAAKGKVLKEFLYWMLDHGEAEATSMTYAPLPKAVADRLRGTIAGLQ